MSIPTRTISYLAGVIDSDGWIGVRRTRTRWAPNYQPGVTVKQVETAAVELAHATLGGHLWRQKPGASGRPLWVWGVTAAAAGRALRVLRGDLRIKREQADNAIAMCDLNAVSGRRRFVVPAVVAGEPLVSATEAAAAVGMSYASVCQATRNGSVPYVREGRRLFIPESFLPVWRDRGTAPHRSTDVAAELERLYGRAKFLNSGHGGE